MEDPLAGVSIPKRHRFGSQAFLHPKSSKSRGDWWNKAGIDRSVEMLRKKRLGTGLGPRDDIRSKRYAKALRRASTPWQWAEDLEEQEMNDFLLYCEECDTAFELDEDLMLEDDEGNEAIECPGCGEIYEDVEELDEKADYNKALRKVMGRKFKTGLKLAGAAMDVQPPTIGDRIFRSKKSIAAVQKKGLETAYSEYPEWRRLTAKQKKLRMRKAQQGYKEYKGGGYEGLEDIEEGRILDIGGPEPTPEQAKKNRESVKKFLQQSSLRKDKKPQKPKSPPLEYNPLTRRVEDVDVSTYMLDLIQEGYDPSDVIDDLLEKISQVDIERATKQFLKKGGAVRKFKFKAAKGSRSKKPLPRWHPEAEVPDIDIYAMKGSRLGGSYGAGKRK